MRCGTARKHHVVKREIQCALEGQITSSGKTLAASALEFVDSRVDVAG